MHRSRTQPIVAAALAAALAAASFGRAGWAAAAELAAPTLDAPAQAPQVPEAAQLPQLAAAAPGLLSAAVPAAASAASAAAVPAAAALRLGAAKIAAAHGDAGRARALGRLLDGSGGARARDLSGAAAAMSPARPAARLSSSSRPGRPAVRSAVLPAPEAQHRSAFFPLALATAASAAAGLFLAAGGLLRAQAAGASSLAWGLHGIAGALGATFGGAAALFAAASLLDAGVFTVAMARGGRVTDAQFQAFLKAEVAAGRLDPGVAQLIEPYRPGHRYRGLSFGLATGQTIYLRPELAASPTLFRIVLIHELHHFNHHRERGPPEERNLRGAWGHVLAELGARASEIRGPQALKDLKVSTLERSLRQAQLSLRSGQDYDVLVLNPSADELKDPAVYRGLSGGRARVQTVIGEDPRALLGAAANAGRYRAVIVDRPFEALPAAGSPEARRLDKALRQLQALHLIATRGGGAGSAMAQAADAEAGRFRELARRAQQVDPSNRKAVEAFERQLRDYWRQVYQDRLKDLAAGGWICGLYASLQDKGLAFLPFGPQDKGVTAWEALLRYWQAEDGGRFQVVRVDLEEGGHVLILRKTEARVGLWIKPIKGGLIKTSVPDADGSPERREAARKALVDAGFADHLARFDALGVKVSQVFGADVRRQEIYITVPRRKAAAIRKYVTGSSMEVEPSEANFQPHLMDAGPLEKVPAVRALGLDGKGQAAMIIDTGADIDNPDFAGREEGLDMVGEGIEDWLIHATHVAGIIGSQDGVFRGMASAARLVAAKVFGRDSVGAADGPIMGAATVAFQRGSPALKESSTIPVVNASFGSRGSSGDNLALFFSNLAEAKNERGESVLVVASAGNSGPFDRTLSQPAAGTGVVAVAAAAKSLDDGRPEIAFYSSVGPDLDPRFAIPRLRLKPDLTAIGGDVTTRPDSPRTYEFGVGSTKSHFGARREDDTPDGKHTFMSGTSMASPMVAGIALHVLKALTLAPGLDAAVSDRLPFSVRAILMRTSRDLGVPIWAQGAGLVDAEAAVRSILPWTAARLRLALSRLPGLSWTAPTAAASSWDWISRYRALFDLEDQVYKQAELAKTEVMARFEETADDGETPPEARQALGNAAYAQMTKSFASARDAAVATLLAALDFRKEPVWLVRMQAALVLLNLKSPDSVMPLAQAALNDPDGRVRQAAFLALAQAPGRAADLLLQKASGDPRWDVGIWAAYALARHGDRSGVARIVAETRNPDKSARQSAIWLLGQLGSRAEAGEAQALSAIVADASQRGNLRHFAAASLTNLAQTSPSAMSDSVFTDLLAAAGAQNLALTRTVSKFFPAALKTKALAERLKAAPLRETVESFVVANRGAAAKPGALGELVTLLSRLIGVPLDSPTPAPDKSGLGVPGVDGDMGELDLIVEPPAGGEAPESEMLSRYEASVAARMPISGTLWLRVPEHKLLSLATDLRRRGFKVLRSRPLYPASAPGPADNAALEVDPSAESLPALPEGPLPVLRIRAGGGVSEARVMAALEALVAQAGDPLARPLIFELDLAAAADGAGASRPLGRLVNRLMLGNVGVVAPAGNAGPGSGTVAAPADSGLAVVVAAASARGPQFYSSRGAPDRAFISWADAVEDLAPSEQARPNAGTGAAALSSAEKLLTLARDLGPRLPDGYFFYLANLVRQSAAPVPGAGADEVGAGLFGDPGRVEAALKRRVEDPARLSREAATLIEAARARIPPAEAASPAPKRAGGWARRLLRSLSRPLLGLTIAAAGAGASTPTPWWKDASATHVAVTVPLYALRRGENDPGIGKFTDLGPYYRDFLAKEGVDTVLLLPHFATLDESPYAPVSLYALDEDNVDWSRVPEVAGDASLSARLRAPDEAARQSVDYAALRQRETAVAGLAYEAFAREQLAAGTERGRRFQEFLSRNARWLEDYAQFMAYSRLIGKPASDWTPQELERARLDPEFARLEQAHRFAQWIAAGQFKDSVDAVHAAGGRILFDLPMFRAKNGVDAWKRPEYFRDLATRNPGIVNQWVHEDWGDLALWNWSRLKREDYRLMLDPFEHWLDFGLDGARVDALHFAYRFGNGQEASGDEPGDDYVRALSAVFDRHRAFPLAEAYEGKADAVSRLGFATVGGDWKKFSSHDDPRQRGFLDGLLRLAADPGSGRAAKFVAYTLGDEWNDPFPVKEQGGGRSLWRYRIPLTSDPDYAARARWDARPQLRALRAAKEGDVWKESPALAEVLRLAAGTFVKHFNDSVEIWAASLDWFLEEWGRDTFVSLPGLLLSTGRYDEAKENLRRFARFERGGLIPNRLPQGGGAEYNTVDGSLWFIEAVKRCWAATGDAAFRDEMMPVVRRIVAAYQKGTGYKRYGRFNRIYMDSDGLIVGPAQATWMDADPEGLDRPVTPRNGKAVEINALWYSALRFAGEDALADRVKRSFNEKFWLETEDNRRAWGGSGGALRDVVEGDPHGDAIRPNMLLAASVGGDLLSPERRRAVVLAATRDLLTPYGPRTLSPRDSFYRARYETSLPPAQKDLAYHQGTVWPWLMGPYLDALAQVRRDQGWDQARIQDEARAAMTPLMDFLVRHPEGSLPEVFDGGTPSPALAGFSLEDPGGLRAALRGLATGQRRGGTRSQAWSVGEALRVLVERAVLPKS